MSEALSLGSRWPELDKIGTCHGNGVSDPTAFTHSVCLGVKGCIHSQIFERTVMYEDTNLQIRPQGHDLAAINKQPWLSVRR